MKRSSAKAATGSVSQSYRTVAIACLIGILITAAVLLLSAVVISSVDFPQSGIAPVAIVAAVLGCFVAGLFCGHATKSAGLLYGLACGSAIYLLTLLCEFSFLGGQIGVLALYKYVICATSAMIGGVLGVNHRRKVR